MTSRALGLGLVLVVLLAAPGMYWLGSPSAGARAAVAVGEPQFGDPVAGLTPFEFELFRLGLEDFLEVEEPEDGLGPVFNGRSCAECHSVPAVGSSGTILELRAGHRNEDGSYTELTGGSLFQLFSIPPHGCQKLVPPEANVFSRRKALPLFGNGLMKQFLNRCCCCALLPTNPIQMASAAARTWWWTSRVAQPAWAASAGKRSRPR